MLRNYVGVQQKELQRLRGDLTAYRQEAQTAFKQKVAYPRASVDLGRVSDPQEDFKEEVMNDITDAGVYNPPLPPDAPVLKKATYMQPPPPVQITIKPAEMPNANIPAMPVSLMKAKSLPVPPSTPITIKQMMEMPDVKNIPAMPLNMADVISGGGAAEESSEERPRRRGAGGARKGAGRPRLGFRSNTELKRMLKRDYGLDNTGSTDELRFRLINASGDERIVYKD